MTSLVSRYVAFTCVAAGLVATAHAAEPAIIAKARAYVGAEATLNAVQSVHYNGTVVTSLASDPSKVTRAAVEIIVQKPDQQRINLTSDKSIETTGLDGYEGWQHVQDAANPKNWRQTVLKPDQLKRIRANAWENLSFFRGIEKVGGRTEEMGTKTVEGVTCQKIGFYHSATIVFYRYFDVATGRLVQTETDDGGVTQEKGEMVVNGIRFPKTITMTTKLANGQVQTSTINFDKIAVNEKFAASQFRIPAPPRP